MILQNLNIDEQYEYLIIIKENYLNIKKIPSLQLPEIRYKF